MKNSNEENNRLERILQILMNGELSELNNNDDEIDVQTVTLNLLTAIKILITKYIELYEGEIDSIKNYNQLIDELLIDKYNVDLSYITNYIKKTGLE